VKLQASQHVKNKAFPRVEIQFFLNPDKVFEWIWLDLCGCYCFYVSIIALIIQS